MSSSQPPEQPPSHEDNKAASSSADASMSAAPPAEAEKMDITPDPPAETWSDLPEELLTASADEIISRRRLIENDIRVRLPSFLIGSCLWISGYALGDIAATTRTGNYARED